MSQENITIVTTGANGICLVFNTTPSYVIYFDRIHGFPLFNGIHGFDVFDSYEEAINAIKQNSDNVRIEHALELIGSMIIMQKCLIYLVSKSNLVGTLLGKHNVYSIEEVKIINFNLFGHDEVSEDVLGQLESFRISTKHYYCKTLDLTTYFGGENRNLKMTWNEYLSNQFRKLLPNVNLCIDLIQGRFFHYEIETNKDLFLFVKRKCNGINVPGCTFGIFRNGDIGNETDVEIIGQKFVDNRYETISHVVIRGTPIFLKEHPEETRLCLNFLINRIAEQYNINSSVFFDFYSKANKNNKLISQYIKDSFEQCKKLFSTDLVQTNLDDDQEISNFLLSLEDILDKFGMTNLFWENDGSMSKITKQSGVNIFTCVDGCSISNTATFFYLLKLLCKFLNFFEITNELKITKVEEIQELTLKYNKIIEFLGNSLINSGDLISELYLSKICSYKKFIMPYIGKIKNEYKSNICDLDFSKIEQNYMNSLSLFLGIKEQIINTTYSSSQGAMLLTFFQTVNVISQKDFDSSIFSYNQSCVLFRKEQNPLVISLLKPSEIKEIIFGTFPIDANMPQPSTVSIYGGMYLNRLFPIFENLSLIKISTSKLLRFAKLSEKNYSYELNINEFENVRYLQFVFSSQEETFYIPNIFVYGTSPKPQKFQINDENHVCFNNNSKPEQEILYPENLSNSFKNILIWEERRLSTFQSYFDFQVEMIKKDINPSLISIDIKMQNLQNILKIENTGENLCSICQSADIHFKCNFCQKCYCKKCANKENIIEGKMICIKCSQVSTRLNELLQVFENMKKIMINKLYPFINNTSKKLNYYQLNYDEDKFFCSFIYQPPFGKDGAIAETIFEDNDEVWSPNETFIPLDISFRQNIDISSIEITCKTPLKLTIFDKQFIFLPPKTSHSLGFFGNRLKLYLISSSIQISRMKFIKKTNFVYQKLFMHQIKPANRLKRHFVPVKHSQQAKYHDLIFDEDLVVYGLTLHSLEKSYSILVEVFYKKQAEIIWSFTLPNNIEGSCQLLFPYPYKADHIRVYYLVSDLKFILPKYIQVLTQS